MGEGEREEQWGFIERGKSFEFSLLNGFCVLDICAGFDISKMAFAVRQRTGSKDGTAGPYIDKSWPGGI